MNGDNDDDTALGKLMHDFHCTQAEEMNYSLLAKRVKYFKETQKGQETMCAIVEEYANEMFEENTRKALIKGFRAGVLTKKGAAVMYPKLKSADIDALYQEAQKPARGRRPSTR